MSDAAPIGAGSAPEPAPPVPDGILRIRGGVGGMSFQLDELLQGAAVLDQLAQRLGSVEVEAQRVQDALEPFLYESYASGCAAIDAVAESRKGIAGVRADLAEVSRDVRASNQAYEFAEAKNALLARTGLDPWKTLGLENTGGFSLRDTTENVIALVLSAAMNVGQGMVPGAALAVGVIPGRSDAGSALRDVLALPGTEKFRPRPVKAEQIGQGMENVDPSMAANLRRLDEIHARGKGEIEIIEVHNGSASTWMVLIPGTEPEKANMGGANPLDEAGIVEALGYGSKDVIPAITQALHEAGAEAGDQVVAVSHSQGGVHAMNLTQDKAFLAEFDLRFVLTAGAPVGGVVAEPGISTLHLEHADDWVPGSDGQKNPDTKDRVTVTLTNPARTPPGEGFGLGPGHRLETYAVGAEEIARSQDPSLVASAGAYAGAVGAGGAATVTRFRLVRDAMPERVHSDPKPSVRQSKSEAGTR
ncbi:hypothetical protein [Paenarthrobacter sp. NPDC018779]|uniref:hypothetical protein n=1 Tax=Paenarthrobacter sp. NPDC018779 TaxID=3364375 RepID=UPI0037C6309B